MADLSGLISGSSGGSQTQTDLLVEAYRRSQQPKLDAINTRQKNLENRKVFYNNLNTKINSLVSQIDTFQSDNSSDKFITRSVTSSNTSVLTATASSSAVLGTGDVFVERLASADLLISKQLSLSGSFGESEGTKSFDLTVNGSTKSVSVTFTGSETNEEAMTKIVNAINNTDDIGVNATYIKDTSSTGRITLTSKTSGSENKITFADSSVLEKLGITSAALNPSTTSRTVSSGTAAGYKTADFNSLDAKLKVNGIDVTRGTNTIDDLLPGITLNLLKPQETGDQSITLTTSVNTGAVESLINPLLSSYNDLLRFVRDNKANQRADSAVSSLYQNLRSISSQQITGLDEDSPSFLTEIGIKINSDGTLSIGDKTKLESYLKDSPDKVADLFTSADGFAAKLDKAISSLVGDDGLIKSRQNSLTDQIETAKSRKTNIEARIDSQADALRKEYEKTLKIYLDAQNQYSYLNTFGTTFTTGN